MPINTPDTHPRLRLDPPPVDWPDGCLVGWSYNLNDDGESGGWIGMVAHAIAAIGHGDKCIAWAVGRGRIGVDG